MPDGRRLRDVPADRAIGAFEKAGYRVDRVSGSHHILKHAGRPTINLPRHRVLKAGLLLAKVKEAGLTVEEFERLL